MSLRLLLMMTIVFLPIGMLIWVMVGAVVDLVTVIEYVNLVDTNVPEVLRRQGLLILLSK